MTEPPTGAKEIGLRLLAAIVALWGGIGAVVIVILLIRDVLA
jgi:hypothetical protein